MPSAQRVIRRRPRCGAVVALLIAAAASLPLAADDAEGRRLDRIAGLCRVWTVAKYEHPALADGQVDWNSAFATAAVAIDDAEPVTRYRAVAAAMLAVVGDPTTDLEPGAPRAAAVVPPQSPPGSAANLGAPATSLVRLLAPGIVGVAFRDFHAQPGEPGLVVALETALKPAMASGVRGVVVDLRAVVNETSDEVDAALAAAAPLLVPRAVQSPAARSRIYHGYPNQRGESSGGYHAAFETQPGTAFAPAGKGGTWHLIFLISKGWQLDDLVWALSESGDAQVVSPRPLDDQLSGLTVAVSLGEGVTARVRVWQPLGRLLVTVPAPARQGSDDPDLAEALRLLEEPWGGPGATKCSSVP